MNAFANWTANPTRNRFRSLILAAPIAAALTLSPQTATAETGTFVSAGVPIHFVDEGSGETVIFLHGFAGSSSMWAAIGLMPLDGYRTIAFDARGHGQSGKPETAADYGEALVDDVIRLMDERGVAAAHIVGYSMGAETALKLVTEHPDRVLSVVAAGSGLSGEVEAESYGFIGMALASAETFAGFMADMTPPDQPELTEEEQAGMMMVLGAHGIDPGQAAGPLSAIATAMPDIISLEDAALAEIAVPVLGIAGENDPERPNIEALAEAVANITIVIVPEADHLMTPLTPEFGTAIRDFLAE